MDLTVLGAGPAYSDRPGAVGAAYLVRHGDDSLLLDLGHGAFANLARAIEPSALGGIAISHLHPDHFIDLVPLRHYLRWEFEPPRRVRVLGPAPLGERLDALHDEPGFAAQALDLEALEDGALVRFGGLVLEARRIRHTDDSFAFRVAPAGAAHDRPGERPGLVYSGDCGAADDLRPLLRAGDTLLAEASYGADPVAPGSEHLNAQDVGRVAGSAGVARVLLTHVLVGHDLERAVEVAAALANVPVAAVAPGTRLAL